MALKFGGWLFCLLVSVDAAAAPVLAPLSVVVERLSEQGVRVAITPGEVLCTGERFVVQVAVDRPSLVSVLMGRKNPDTQDQVELVASAKRMVPGQFQQMPNPRTSFELDERTGIEYLFVAAQPIEEGVAPMVEVELVEHVHKELQRVPALKKRKAENQQGERICRVPDKSLRKDQAPPGSFEKYRNLVVKQNLKSKKQAGVVLLTIPIDHR